MFYIKRSIPNLFFVFARMGSPFQGVEIRLLFVQSAVCIHYLEASSAKTAVSQHSRASSSSLRRKAVVRY